MRLLTRTDFDGLACAALLVQKGIVDSFNFVHPKDVQDGNVEVTEHDVLANIPYAPGCGLWFDHHASEHERLEIQKIEYKGDSRLLPSAAQVIWDYYGGQKTFGKHFLPLLEAVNKTDSGNLTREEILNPEGWILVYFLVDPRTGLGRIQDFRISHRQFIEDMIRYCRTWTVKEILRIPDVQERENRYFAQQELFRVMLNRCCRTEGNVIVTNLLEEDEVYCGNRFIVYALYPEPNVEIRVMWGKNRQNVVINCGRSIINKTSMVDVGKLMLEYGGGGHEQVGTCQISADKWEKTVDAIIKRIRQ